MNAQQANKRDMDVQRAIKKAERKKRKRLKQKAKKRAKKKAMNLNEWSERTQEETADVWSAVGLDEKATKWLMNKCKILKKHQRGEELTHEEALELGVVIYEGMQRLVAAGHSVEDVVGGKVPRHELFAGMGGNSHDGATGWFFDNYIK